jgi:methylenetetrahydrofolate reductase (NADPH)
VTQFFFEVEQYTSLMDDLAARRVDKPVLPGIMPVTSLRSIPRMATMGAAVPGWAVERLEAAATAGGDEAVERMGISLATELCEKLLDAGAPGLHFYTLNRSSATRDIYAALGLAAAAER